MGVCAERVNNHRSSSHRESVAETGRDVRVCMYVCVRTCVCVRLWVCVCVDGWG